MACYFVEKFEVEIDPGLDYKLCIVQVDKLGGFVGSVAVVVVDQE